MMSRSGLPVCQALLAMGFSLLAGRIEASCVNGSNARVTDDFYFTATSAQGAVGDVVAIEFSLTVEELNGSFGFFGFVASYDASKAELLGQPILSDFFNEYCIFPDFQVLEPLNGAVSYTGRSGFKFVGSISQYKRPGLHAAIEAEGPAPVLPLLTLYFRLKGQAGDTSAIRFSDEEFGQGVTGGPEKPCVTNYIYYFKLRADGTAEESIEALSSRHASAELVVLEGEPTHTEVPELPPAAKIYESAPGPEDVDVTFELSGGAVSPGEADVPVEFHVTSNFDFTGCALAATFPPEYLELSRVEHRVIPGGLYLNPELGEFSYAVLGSTRRVGGEGERVHVATFYFNVKEAAATASELRIAIEDFGYINWIGIRHLGEPSADPLPIVSQVEPLTLKHAILNVLPEVVAFIRGDSNGDDKVDLSDAMTTLNFLFLGEGRPYCFDASDSNDDGRIDISDASAILGFLFLGSANLPPPGGVPGEDPTEDAMTCRHGNSQ